MRYVSHTLQKQKWVQVAPQKKKKKKKKNYSCHQSLSAQI